jgi:hypothetical protein
MDCFAALAMTVEGPLLQSLLNRYSPLARQWRMIDRGRATTGFDSRATA